MSGDDKKLILIDAMALAYRGHFALINNPRKTSGGMNTSSIFVFANVMLDLLKKEKPSHMAVAFDTSEPTFRHREFSEYKAQREAMPEELSIAIPYLYKLCAALNIPALKLPGWEADDIVGTLVTLADNLGVYTCMVTPDKDYGQLVSEHAVMYKPSKMGGFDVWGIKEIQTEWEIERPEQVIDILGLMGDASDNIPGVPGIGPKTAKKLIAQYGNLETLLQSVDELKGKQKENMIKFREQAILSKRLATIDRQSPIPWTIEELSIQSRNDEATKALFKELEFTTLGTRLFGQDFALEMDFSPKAAHSNDSTKAKSATASSSTENSDTGGDDIHQGEIAGELSTAKSVFHSYHLVNTASERMSLIQKLVQQKRVCFDTETTGLNPKSCDLLGIAFCWQPHEAYYVPFPGICDDNKVLLEEFREFFSNAAIEKIGHNCKYDVSVLLWHGFEVQGALMDTMLAAFLTMPDKKRNMDALSEDLLGYKPISITELIGPKGSGQKNMSEVAVETVCEYAAEDADVTLQLSDEFANRVAESNQTRVLYEIEGPLIAVLAGMEREGIRVDTKALQEFSLDLEKQMREYSARIRELAGEEINLNSPKQLGVLLFEKLALDPEAKRTQKTGQYATNEQVLQRLAGRHEIVQKILDYRQVTKLKSTYVDALPGFVHKDTGRIHTTYEQAVAATGRLQSNHPNLQNIPIRSELGKEIRRAFVPRDKDYLLLAADYSQIELRIAAELSGDEAMLDAFRSGFDIHTATAGRMFHVEAERVDADMRRRAKTVNFGILYGISAFGLAERSDFSRTEAKEIIELYFNTYPKLRQWLDDTIAFAHDKGFVETVTGRRRYLPDIHSRNGTIMKAAERVAINAPIQGTAADMIKLAMVKIHHLLRAKKVKSRMLLQVHDELVFDLHRDEMEAVPDLVEEAMRTALPMKVPIVVEMGIGDNWLDAH